MELGTCPQCSDSSSYLNPNPAEPGLYPDFANTVDLKKPTDLDLHCLSLSM